MQHRRCFNWQPIYLLYIFTSILACFCRYNLVEIKNRRHKLGEKGVFDRLCLVQVVLNMPHVHLTGTAHAQIAMLSGH